MQLKHNWRSSDPVLNQAEWGRLSDKCPGPHSYGAVRVGGRKVDIEASADFINLYTVVIDLVTDSWTFGGLSKNWNVRLLKCEPT